MTEDRPTMSEQDILDARVRLDSSIDRLGESALNWKARAEAAERKVAKVAELVARLDAGLGTTATYGIAFMAIRRALAED